MALLWADRFLQLALALALCLALPWRALAHLRAFLREGLALAGPEKPLLAGETSPGGSGDLFRQPSPKHGVSAGGWFWAASQPLSRLT